MTGVPAKASIATAKAKAAFFIKSSLETERQGSCRFRYTDEILRNKKPRQ
jgi:hypothetical protein